MTEEKILKSSILNALSKVQDPELHKDLVTLNMVHDLEIKDFICKIPFSFNNTCMSIKRKNRKRS